MVAATSVISLMPGRLSLSDGLVLTLRLLTEAKTAVFFEPSLCAEASTRVSQRPYVIHGANGRSGFSTMECEMPPTVDTELSAWTVGRPGSSRTGLPSRRVRYPPEAEEL